MSFYISLWQMAFLRIHESMPSVWVRASHLKVHLQFSYNIQAVPYTAVCIYTCTYIPRPRYFLPKSVYSCLSPTCPLLPHIVHDLLLDLSYKICECSHTTVCSRGEMLPCAGTRVCKAAWLLCHLCPFINAFIWAWLTLQTITNSSNDDLTSVWLCLVQSYIATKVHIPPYLNHRCYAPSYSSRHHFSYCIHQPTENTAGTSRLPALCQTKQKVQICLFLGWADVLRELRALQVKGTLTNGAKFRL